MIAMRLTVNGEPRDVAEGATVSQLLEQLKIAPERVVVEVNLKILKRSEHAATVLAGGDRVEVVQFVGGGSFAMRNAECGVRNGEKPCHC